ncbi:ABC transporter ATP-binding protein [Octadecabacter sp. G9-8]|uniref:ABC transporter ATP-binding protein n=1 Tax=Octadecabacter dasysiphoniae TaxID=2909341 RepID=A0ABS9D0E9_9RHOB|nr:ABC transporter ATP-binding protein [Octadecabacter dasysiphoniae]MCF2873005.1 ABC transporter ATP-binding protein [Octadecabacter dasysiphoniae]
MSALLSIKDLQKSFGAVIVADASSFDVAQGEAVGILGPNGAGKTSLFNLITGALRADAGTIHFDDQDITKISAAARCKLGVARSFQIPQPFAGMTVFENALVGATQGGGLRGREAEVHALDVLDETGLADKANMRAGSLSLLERKRLELARALSAKPKLLLLDEIAGGLTDAECGALIDTIKRIHANGTTIIWIEHVVHALMAVAERLIVIDFGRKIAEGEPKAVMDSPEVKEIYLGIAADA